MSMVDQRIYDRLGILAVDFDQHDIAGMTFDECCNLTIVAAEKQATFPVTGDGPILHRVRTFDNRYCADDSAVMRCLLGMMTRATHASCTPKMLQQLFFQGTTGLNEETAKIVSCDT